MTQNRKLPQSIFIISTLILTALFMNGCSHSTQVSDQDRTTASSVDGIKESREASYAHGGNYNFNPKVGPVVPVEDVDATLAQRQQQKIKNLQTPDLVITKKQHYHYQPNVDDIVARHTFVLMDTSRTLGHHVAFFQSRHQHHVVLKLKYDFSGKGLSPVDQKSVLAGQAIFNNTILKSTPKSGFYSVQVAPGTNFELMTIATGNTRKFKGIFTDGIVGLSPLGARFSDPKKAAFDVIVEVEAVHHFNRMFASEDELDLQYMVFKNKGADANSYVMVHLINGKLKKEVTGTVQDLNIEQALIVKSANTNILEGTIVKINGRTPTQLLRPTDKIQSVILRTGFDEDGTLNNTVLDFEVGSQIYNRSIGIDPDQRKILDTFINSP